jgi:hypothetical protein
VADTVVVAVPVPSLTVQRRVYAPAVLNRTVAALAAFVPLAENVGATAPVGAVTTDQV